MRKWASESCGLPPPAGAPALLPGCQLTSSLWPQLLRRLPPPPPQAPPLDSHLWAYRRQLYTPHPGSLPGVCVRKRVAGSVTQTYSRTSKTPPATPRRGQGPSQGPPELNTDIFLINLFPTQPLAAPWPQPCFRKNTWS